MPGQGNTQGPEGKVPFIFNSLSLLKGSRAIRETHGCDDFPWLSVAAGCGSLCDEWSGKKNGGRRADWKKSKKEKSRRESGIKDGKGKTRGGSADCLLASSQLFPSLLLWERVPFALQVTLQPLKTPAGLGLLPLPASAETLSCRHLSDGMTTKLVHQQPKDRQESPGTQETPRQNVHVCVYI